MLYNDIKDKPSFIFDDWKLVQNNYPDYETYNHWYSRMHNHTDMHGDVWHHVTRTTSQERWKCSKCGVYVPDEMTGFIKLLEWRP